jgi:hypothetical protein
MVLVSKRDEIGDRFKGPQSSVPRPFWNSRVRRPVFASGLINDWTVNR